MTSWLACSAIICQMCRLQEAHILAEALGCSRHTCSSVLAWLQTPQDNLQFGVFLVPTPSGSAPLTRAPNSTSLLYYNGVAASGNVSIFANGNFLTNVTCSAGQGSKVHTLLCRLVPSPWSCTCTALRDLLAVRVHASTQQRDWRGPEQVWCHAGHSGP